MLQGSEFIYRPRWTDQSGVENWHRALIAVQATISYVSLSRR